MKSINLSALAIFLFALPYMAFAQVYTSMSTFTTTRTVYRVYTETATGTPPAYNTPSYSTFTSVGTAIYPTYVPSGSGSYVLSGSGSYVPSGSGSYTNATGTGYVSATLSTIATQPQFTGAASHLFNKDAAVAAIVAGLGLLAL